MLQLIMILLLITIIISGIKDDDDLKKFKDLLKQSDISINATDKVL